VLQFKELYRRKINAPKGERITGDVIYRSLYSTFLREIKALLTADSD
jgi:hypothetical protein